MSLFRYEVVILARIDVFYFSGYLRSCLILSGILLVVVVGGKMTDVAAVDIDVRCLL